MLDLTSLKAVWFTPAPRKKGTIYYSASQFKTFDDCEMKWGYDKIDKIPRGQSIYTEFGTDGHKLGEAHLDDEELPNVGDDVYDVFHQGLAAKKLPEQKSGLAEWQFHLPIYSRDGKFLGIIDGYIDYTTVEDGAVIVWDHKFTSNIKYAMSPNPNTQKALAKDIQAIVYAKLMFEMLKNLEYVECRWMYYGATKHPTSKDARPRTPGGFKRVDYAYTREDLESRWGDVQDLAERIFEARRTKRRALELVANTKSCPKYGGCEYRGVCEDERSRKAMGFLDALSNTVEIKKEKEMPTIAELKARRAEKNKVEDAQKIEPQDTINPPDYAEDVIQKAEAAVDKLEGKKPRKVSKKEAVEKNAEIDKETAKKKAAPKKRGRPGKKAKSTTDKEAEKNKTATESVPQEEAASGVSKTPDDTPKKKKYKTPKAKDALVLYMDCLPIKNVGHDHVMLSDYLAPAKRAIEEEHERLYWNLLKYREGEQLLAAHCKVLIKEEPPKGPIFVDTKSNEWKACADVLSESASVMIQGI